MSVLPLAYYGDPILRQKAEEVGEITDEIRQLVADMMVTMEATGNGVGLAAPQVKRPLRIFITNVDYEDDEGEAHYLETPQVFINPALSDFTEELVEYSEGCLSIPTLHAPVIRPLSVTIEATDLDGNRFKETYTRYKARVILHEFDHLEGILFIDRIKGKRRTQLEATLRQIKMKYKS